MQGGIFIAAYIPFTQDQLYDAKHADLAAFLEARGESLRRSGSELEWVDHHVTIRGHQFFDQYESCGGTAIDFVRKYFNASFQDAVQALLGQNAIVAAPAEPRQRERERPQFQLPPKNENMRRVYAYLLKQRRIDRAVLDYFAHKHLVYESADYHNAVFVGTDEDGNPRHAHKRSTGSESGWRCNQAGSEAAFAFHHIGTSGTIYAFEAPIDLLSFISMYQKDWQQHSYVALCGVSDEALTHQLSAHENLREAVLCLDNDQAGHQAAERISRALRDKGCTASALVPSDKDWNQTLQNLSGQGVAAQCLRMST
ncbi:MAG: DUF3991 and toprim domain-containing protein [Oscillospiraceae bacterium]|nr:DUF3991 and toprim domain-containing protein [Oscillospiraceae bacterium]